MFKEGELIMYGTMGVCKVIRIARPDFLDEDDETLFYFIEPIYKSGTFYAPVNSDNISLRKVISQKEAKDLIGSIGRIRPKVFSTVSVQQLSQHYQDIIDTHDARELIKLIKSIYAKEEECKKKNKKLGQIDKRYLKKAEELLYGELACSLKKDLNQIEEMVKGKL